MELFFLSTIFVFLKREDYSQGPHSNALEVHPALFIHPTSTYRRLEHISEKFGIVLTIRHFVRRIHE